ncbi:beta strand repeat-containing protein [Nereida sp. NH-UV-3]|uniref:beta strand repeat-containing protein n=1 Tax=Nereida TaxID=282198 RepID=UPI0036F38CA7
MQALDINSTMKNAEKVGGSSATSKLAKAWESKNAKNAAKASGLTLMALSLSACGGSDSTPAEVEAGDSSGSTVTPITLKVQTSPDSVTLTSGDDVVDGKVANSFGDKADVIVDASTTDSDVANIFVTAAPTTGSLLQNIETVNLTLGGDVTATGMILGANEINVSSTAAAHTLTMADVASGTSINIVDTSVYGATSAAANLTVDAATAAAELNVGVSAGGSTTLDYDGSGQVEFATLNINSTGGVANTVVLADISREQAGDKIVVTGDTDITITGRWADFGSDTSSSVEATIDASEATGVVAYSSKGDLTASHILDASKMTGVDKFILTHSGTKGHSIDGTVKIDDMTSGQIVEMNGYSSGAAADDLVLELADATSASDAITFVMNDKLGTESQEIDDLTVTGVNNVTIESTGISATTAGAALTNSIADIITTTSGSTLNLTGDKKLVVDGTVDELFTTINAAANTGGVDLTMADVAANTAFTGGTGNDRIDVHTKLTYEDNLVGGAGEDTLVIEAGTAASTAVLSNTGTTGNTAGFSGFEILEINNALDLATSGGDVTVDLTKEAGMNELKLAAAVTVDSNDTFTVKAASGFTLELDGSGDIAGATGETNFIVSVTDATTAGTDDVVNLVLDQGTSSSDLTGLSIDGVETLNIVENDNHASNTSTIEDIHGSVLQTINISGAKNSSNVVAKKVVLSDLNTSNLSTLNAAEHTGALDIDGLDNNFSALGATITGAAGVNSIRGGTGSDSITGGASADTIFGADGLDTIVGAAGGDVLIGDGGGSTKEAMTTVIGSGGFTASSDTIAVTMFGATVTVASAGTTATDTGAEMDDILAAAINDHAILGNLVTATATSSGDDGGITVTAEVDGNFTDFDYVSGGGAGAVSGEAATNGSASSDGVDTITAGTGADFIAGGKGADVINLAVDQQADTVVILAGGLGDVITGFESGANGTDVIVFANDLTKNGTASATLKSITNEGTVAANDSYIEITTATVAGGADTAAEIATFLDGLTITNVDDSANDIVMFAVNDGTDTYIWQWTEDSTNGVQADDLALGAVLKGVTDLENGDIGFIA